MLKEAVFSSLITVVTDQSLNPYFNGTCSKSLQTASAYLFALGLNPYFNGTCSKSTKNILKNKELSVLILILMEHAQRGSRFTFEQYQG